MDLVIGIAEDLIQAAALQRRVFRNLPVWNRNIRQLQQLLIEPFAVGILRGVAVLDRRILEDRPGPGVDEQHLARLQAGCAQAMEQEACQLLDKLTANNQLNSQTLRYFYQDFMQMLFSLPEKKRQDDMFREPEALELYRNGMKTVPDMKALVHYVASVWDSETEESSQSTVEIIMAYIAEHLENELRREELAEAVHLNPDYMARLFKKETGMNLKDYIIQQKMQEAQSLLCTTNLPISLIAAKVGYTNFGHFSTSYKKFYHKTPQEERSAAL